MARVTISVPDELAADMDELAAIVGISKSAFMTHYIQRNIRRLIEVANEYPHLTSSSESPMRNRGESAAEALAIAEAIVDAMEKTRSAE